MPHYSEEFKEKLVREIMSPNGRSISEIHRAIGVSENTLYSWKNKYGGGKEPGSRKRAVKAEGWDGGKKLLVLIETEVLNEQEMSEYCRENGLYAEQIERWRELAIAGTESGGTVLTKAQKQEWQKDKKRLGDLEKELKRKEKALAEAAALLVLEKKAHLTWGDAGDE